MKETVAFDRHVELAIGNVEGALLEDRLSSLHAGAKTDGESGGGVIIERVLGAGQLDLLVEKIFGVGPARLYAMVFTFARLLAMTSIFICMDSMPVAPVYNV